LLYSNLVTVLALSLPLGNHDERRKDAIKAFTVNEGFEEVFDTMCFRHILSRQASTRTGARQHRRGGTGDAGAGPPASGKTLHPASSSPQEAKPSRDVRIFIARADMDARVTAEVPAEVRLQANLKTPLLSTSLCARKRIITVMSS
jgi:hypothetical protein